MDLESLIGEAESLVNKAGGADAVAKDAMQLKDVVTGDGSLVDKAKQAASIVQEAEAGPHAAAGDTPKA